MAEDNAVARTLREIALLLEVEGANRYRARAYEQAARAVEALGDSHTTYSDGAHSIEEMARGADAHSVAALDNLRWGVDMARRGWLSRGDVLNTLGVDEFRAAVRP